MTLEARVEARYLQSGSLRLRNQICEKIYKITVDWKGSKYVGIRLDWDCKTRVLHTSVSDFFKKALNKHQHPTPPKYQHASTQATPINYGVKSQAPTPGGDSPLLQPERIRQVQDTVGTFTWYSCATDLTMAQTLRSIAGHQSKATQQLREEVIQFLDYCTTHPDAQIRF